jgi:pimeloyl-ACP methyl ester carboxylesterase
VTITWAEHHPRRAAALVLEDPPVRVGPPTIELMDRFLADSTLSPAELDAQYAANYPDWSAEARRRRVVSQLATNPAVFREARARAERLMAENGGAWAPAFGALPPTLVIYGDLAAGGMMAPGDVEQMVATVPGLRASLIAGAGHNLHRDNTAEFLALAVPFLLAAR